MSDDYVRVPLLPLTNPMTVFTPDDFKPRKGVMTRYGKKMLRADLYGQVDILQLTQPTIHQLELPLGKGD